MPVEALPCVLPHGRGSHMILASGLWQSTPLTFGYLLLPRASVSVKAFPTLQHPLSFVLALTPHPVLFSAVTRNAPTKIVAEVSCTVDAHVPLPNICEKFKMADIHLGELR